MFCSTIIPTIGRSTLSRSVQSILDQTFTADDFEVIVVNDSGQPLLEAEWQQSKRVRIIHTNRRRLSVARNAGAAIARGRYLHFLDDDDWLLPGALETFWTLAQQAPNAVLLYGGTEFVDETGKHLGELNLGMSGNCSSQIVAGSWIPAQAMLIQTETFFTVGGFNPLFGPVEEIELSRRIALRDDFAHTPAMIVCLLRGAGWDSTVNYDHAIEFNRWSRDIALSEPGAFARMRASANSSYWYGRIFHAYLTAILWNLRHKNLFKAVSRAVFWMISFALAGQHVLSADFWRAVGDSQVPCTAFHALKHIK